MKLLEIRTIAGPNVYHNKPVLAAMLDLQELADTSSTDLPNFTEKLTVSLPGLYSHRCSLDKPGGFIERLGRGTYFAHIVEHIALELSTLAGIPVGYGKSIYGGSHGIYKVIVRYTSEEGMKFLLRTAVEFADALAHNTAYPLSNKIKEAIELIERTDLGPSTQAIVTAAEERNIPWTRLNENNLVQLGYGKYRKLIQATTTSQTSQVGVDIAQDKELTKRILRQALIRVPHGIVVTSEEESLGALQELATPVVIKPLDGHHGNGVSINLTSSDEVRQGFRFALKYSRSVLVEEYIDGHDYRVLVVNGKMVAAAERIPAHVVGDGAKTIAQLIERENQDIRRGVGHTKSMSKIEMDAACEACLKKFGKTSASVPNPGEVVILKMTANLSTGGSAHDVTDKVHPETRAVCERAARIIGLDVCGIDIIVSDIARSLPDQKGGIIEVNAGPGIRMHHSPSKGQPRDAGGAIVEMLFPQKSSSRIPIISVTGTNGKTSVIRMIGHVFNQARLCVGMTTTDGITIGNMPVEKGDTTGPASARAVLCDSAVDIAILETARGGIIRRGLGYDWSDVGVLTNIQPDHIGQDGIETIEDILRIKSIVAERVREGGALILNADDERLAGLPENKVIARIKRNIIYFSLYSDHLVLRKHLSSGGTAYFVDKGWLVESKGERQTCIIRSKDIPATFNGTADFQIQNALAAIATCRVQELPLAQISDALSTFDPRQHNQGRANIYQVNGGYLLVDFGHNMNAFKAIANMARQWDGRRITGIIALPGDRTDAIIEEAAKVAAQGFDKILIREDIDLRGRKRGEVASLIRSSIQTFVPTIDCRIILDEITALKTAVSEMELGEVIVLFYDKLDSIQLTLGTINARPISSLQSLLGQNKAA